jgi:hypothetical protein
MCTFVSSCVYFVRIQEEPKSHLQEPLLLGTQPKKSTDYYRTLKEEEDQMISNNNKKNLRHEQ